MGNPLINFRCNPELLEAIADIGKQLYPKNNDNGFDQSKTILHLLELGIESIDNCKTSKEISKTKQPGTNSENLDAIKSQLRQELITELAETVEALRVEVNDRVDELGKQLA